MRMKFFIRKLTNEEKKERERKEKIEVKTKEQAIIFLKEVINQGVFNPVSFIYLNKKCIGMPKSQNCFNICKKLIKKYNITEKDLLDL